MTNLNKLDREAADSINLDTSTQTILGDPIVRNLFNKGTKYHPSTNPAQAIELLKEHKLGVVWNDGGKGYEWLANDGEHYLHGSTPEIAICRAVVAAKSV